MFALALLFLVSLSVLGSTQPNSTRYSTFSTPYRHSSTSQSDRCQSITISEKEGWLFSPNFPNNYDNYVQCNYNINKYSQDVCAIELTITDFDIESSPDCTADYLDLGDGSARMCGILVADTRKIVSFPSGNNQIKMRFVSNPVINRKGFMAKVRQLRNSCPPYVLSHRRNQTYGQKPTARVLPPKQPIYLGSYCDIYIGELTGDLRSPGFPYGYHSNQSCVYSIRRAAADICQVELILHQFNIDSDGKCDADHLELPDGSRICGSLPPQKRVYPFSRSSDFLVIRFRSDSVVNQHVTGFWIEVRQLRNSCDAKNPQNAVKCDQTLSGEVSTIYSPNYPHFYGPSQQCLYFLEPLDKSVCDFELEFVTFDVESARDYFGICNNDYFRLPDNEVRELARGQLQSRDSNNNKLCGHFLGSKVFSFPKFRDRLALFSFTSDDKREDRGFEIRVKQRLNSCYPTTYGFRMATTRPTTPSYVTNGSAFTTNATFVNCDKLVTAGVDVIASPNYPNNYPKSTRCIYTFTKTSAHVCQIRVKILDFDLEETRDCSADYLLVEPTNQRFCGQFTQSEDKIINFPNYTNELRLIFSSDRQSQRPGFRIRTQQIPNSCANPVIEGKAIVHSVPLSPVAVHQPFVAEQPITAASVVSSNPTTSPQICASSSAIVSTFQSDNYPLAYNAYTNCVYRVFRASRHVCRVQVEFHDFDVGLEDLTHKTCINGYVEINHVKYCGRRKDERVVIDFGPEKTELTLRFHTESAVRYGGFRIQVRQLDDNCQHNHIAHEFSPASTESCNKVQFGEESLEILSPHYESGSYQPFLDCLYLIRKMSFDVCALEVRFDAFSLEESKTCSKDYLEMGSDRIRLCGKLPFGVTRTFEFTSDEMQIKFHTDGEIQDSGFRILVKQIKC